METLLGQATGPDISRAEYLSVVIGIIVGLSLTRILTCISSSLPKEPEDKWSLTHSILLTAAFIFQVNYWWNLYDDEVIERVSFWGYLIILTVPLLMYLATATLTPELNRDLREHFNFHDILRRRSNGFYFFVMAVLVMMIIQGYFIWQDLWDQPLTYALRIGVLAIILVFHRIRVGPVQFLLAVFLLIAMMAYTTITPDGFSRPTIFKQS